MQVAGTFAGFAGHLGTEALNASYYMEEFDSFLHKLQDPVVVPFPPVLTCSACFPCTYLLSPALPVCKTVTAYEARAGEQCVLR